MCLNTATGLGWTLMRFVLFALVLAYGLGVVRALITDGSREASAGRQLHDTRRVLGPVVIVDTAGPATSYNPRRRANFSVPAHLSTTAFPTQSNTQSTFNYEITGSDGDGFRDAIDFAFSILSRVWVSDVPTNVLVSFEILDSAGRILASAGPAGFFPVTDNAVAYPGPAGEAAVGKNLNDPGEFDIQVKVNSVVDWYRGTDADPGESQSDFVTVFLHEVIHGLGFVGVLDASNGQAIFHFGGPTRFDQFLGDGDGCSILSFQDRPDKLYQAVTNSFLYFVDDSGGLVAELYAPEIFASGSSVYHLSDELDDTPDDLQTPSLPPGVANHNIGSVTSTILSLLSDSSKTGAPFCENQRDPADAPDRDGGSIFTRTLWGLPVWLLILLFGAVAFFVASLAFFLVSTIARRSSR